MDKKGYLVNFIFGMMGFFILILVLVSLLPIQEDAFEDPYKAIYYLNDTQNTLIEQFQINESDNIIIRVTYSFISFIMYSSIEVAETAVSYGIENPEWINAKFLIWIVLLSLLTPVFLGIFKILIITVILIREYFQNRKEKKELRQS